MKFAAITLATNLATNLISLFSDWATGKTPAHPTGYHTLIQCMQGDTFWITLTVFLDLAVAVGYLIIAYHWYHNQRRLTVRSPARVALFSMRNIFIFCGLCGYLFIPIKMVWPGWRVYDFFLAILVFYTWKYAWNATSLKVIYSELGRSHQLTQELARSREEAKRKGFFLNAISHDLRTPLNGIMLQAHMADAALRASDPEAAQKALTEIKASAKLTGDVLNTLLQYARLESDAPSPSTFHIDDLLHALENSFRAAATNKSLVLEFQTRGRAAVYTDRAKLERILMNLVDNAIKFTARGKVSVYAAVDGAALIIHVADTGEGISEENQQRLFQEFFQVHNIERNRTQGVGLGLAIARRLADQLGGSIVVDSSPDAGSRFTLTLPNAAALPTPPSISSATTPSNSATAGNPSPTT